MYIERIKIDILTETEETYGVDLSLIDEKQVCKKINLIYGENTLGKSTLIKSIIYALGGEEVYGKSRDVKPNFPSVMSRIDDERVIKNEITLQLSNNNKRIVIVRDALNKFEPVKVFEELQISDLAKDSSPLYLKIDKTRGVDSSDLFQEYMFEFMGFPYLLNEDTGLALMYIQNLLPLFVIPQHGWSDIQSCNPFYNVHGVKQKAFELIMGFNNIKAIEENVKLKKLLNDKRDKTLEQSKIIENISIYKTKDIHENENVENDIHLEIERNEMLKKELETSKLYNSKVTRPLKLKYKELVLIKKNYEQKKTILEREINEFSSYNKNLDLEIMKLDKLNNAKRLISSLPVKECPHCFNEIELNPSVEIMSNRCFLCGNEIDKRKDSSRNEIYKYLKDERKDFTRFIQMKESELLKINSSLIIINLEIDEIKGMLDAVELELNPEFLNEYHLVSRNIGKLKSELSIIKKEKVILGKLKQVEDMIVSLEKEIKAKRTLIKLISSKSDDKIKLEKFEEYFKEILLDLDFIKEGFDGLELEKAQKKYYDKIYIDRDTYYPKVEDNNLYNITSSSGFIRIMLAYYLAIMKVSINFTSTNFPKILILDEPKQQNLDDGTFDKFTSYLKEFTKDEDVQVIIASGNMGKLSNHDVLIHLEDYLIKKN